MLLHHAQRLGVQPRQHIDLAALPPHAMQARLMDHLHHEADLVVLPPQPRYIRPIRPLVQRLLVRPRLRLAEVLPQWQALSSWRFGDGQARPVAFILRAEEGEAPVEEQDGVVAEGRVAADGVCCVVEEHRECARGAAAWQAAGLTC